MTVRNHYAIVSVVGKANAWNFIHLNMKIPKFVFTEDRPYKPTLYQSDIDLMLRVLDYYVEHHPKPRMAVEMASNIRNYWKPENS